MSNSYFAWEENLFYGEQKQYENQSTVFFQGEKGYGFYYLIKGRIINRFLSEKGNERFINHIAPGTLFGEEGSNGSRYLSTATAIAPSLVCYFSEQAFIEICKDNPQAAITFTNFQIDNFRKKIQLIQKLDSNIETQLKFYLSQYAYESLDIPFNQTIIANDLNTSRVTINKVIRKWKENGIIELSNQMIHILNKNWFLNI